MEAKFAAEKTHQQLAILQCKLELQGHDEVKRTLCMKDWMKSTQADFLKIRRCPGISQLGSHAAQLGEPTKVKIGNQNHFVGAAVPLDMAPRKVDLLVMW